MMKFDKAIQKICLFKELYVNPKWSNFVKKKKYIYIYIKECWHGLMYFFFSFSLFVCLFVCLVFFLPFFLWP